MSAVETIKKLRRKMMLDRNEFGDMLGVSAISIYNYERGLRNPSRPVIRVIQKLCEKNGIKFKVEDFVK